MILLTFLLFLYLIRHNESLYEFTPTFHIPKPKQKQPEIKEKSKTDTEKDKLKKSLKEKIDKTEKSKNPQVYIPSIVLSSAGFSSGFTGSLIEAQREFTKGLELTIKSYDLEQQLTRLEAQIEKMKLSNK